MTFVTIVDGEQALIFNPQGQGRLIVGPARVWKSVREDIEHLRRYVASQDQYMIVKYKDGHKENIPGPLEKFHNKLEIETIQVVDAIKLDANHLIVVYKQQDDKIEKRIVRGPTIFVPNAHEWLHDFVWHGSDPSNPGRFIPQRSKFTKLLHVPSQIYCNVKDVRTNDDTLITVKLMLFYQLKDVETMLNATHDPIADFINAVQSDIVTFASQRNYEEFIQQTHDLNSMDSYKQLTHRSQLIGYNITKVVYRGYEASVSLQETHDKAVQTRTHIRLNTEAEEKEQVLQKFKLQREKKRTKLKQEMERKVQDHKQEVQKLRRATNLDKQRLVHEQKLKKETKEVELQVEMEKLEHGQKTRFLEKLQELGVDMTKYSLSLQQEFVPQREIVVGPATKEIVLKPSTV